MRKHKELGDSGENLRKDVNYEGTDVAASAMVAVIVLGGVVAAWQTGDQLVATIYFFGSLLTACLVGGIYLYGRLNVLANEEKSRSLLAGNGGTETEAIGRPGREEGAGVMSAESVEDEPVDDSDEETVEPALSPEKRTELLADFPADERRIIDPILASPGLTQVDVRDRSDFSKSKVSQTVTDLEDRGLIRRERDGRTYRIYPDGDLAVEE